MTVNTLHIIASCTDRKRAKVPSDLHLRSVPVGETEFRAKAWKKKVESSSVETSIAAELYAGEYWSTIKTLPMLAEKVGFHAQVWILSAGYGLLPDTAHIKPYSATFSGSHLDSVAAGNLKNGSRRKVLQSWWESLNKYSKLGGNLPNSLSELFRRNAKSTFLVVASVDYLTAVEQDLLNATSYLPSSEQLIIISSRSALKTSPLRNSIVATDARLQSVVGGTRGAISARLASMIIQNDEIRKRGVIKIQERMRSLISRSPALIKYDRKRLDDDQIKRFIRRTLLKSENVSCSSLLREFRSSGHACEQGRFKRLFQEVKAGNYET